ncbi:MAG: tape measure protein [Saprospiraceae bacterium]|nr:tape measure protein [Saprospiraceae bacterium]
MAIGDLNVRIGATIKGLQAGLKSAERELKTFARQTNNLGNSLTLGLSVPLAGIGAAAVQAFAQFEGLKNGLTAIAGSAQEAEAQLTRLRKIALQPSVNLDQAVKASVQLQTVGFQAEEAENAISQFAKAATLSNAGAEGLAAVVKQITQINSKGKILQEDIGIILENVPSVGLALKDAFGTTSVEAIRASGISAKEFTDRLIQAIEASETFQSAQGGLATQIENFGIGLKESGVALGEAIAKSINLGATLEKLTGFVNKVVEGFKALTPEQQKAIVQIGLLVIAIGPAIKVISLLASGITALLSPINLVIAAIVVLASAFIYAYNTNEQFRGGVLGSVAAIGEVITIFKEAAQALANGFKQIGEGDFSGAVKSFGEFIKKGNPIGLAVTEGERLANAYRDGFAKAATAGKLPTVSEFISNATGGAKAAALPKLGAGGGAISEPTKVETTGLQEPIPLEIPFIPTLTLSEDNIDLSSIQRVTDALKAEFDTLPDTIKNTDQSILGLTERINTDMAESFQGIRGEVEALDAAMQKNSNVLTESKLKVLEVAAAMADAGDRISRAIETGISNGLAAFGEALGSFAAGVGKAANLGYILLDALLGIVQEVGKILIQLGIGLIAVQIALESLNPYVAIAAGVALIALASYVRSSLQKQGGRVQEFATGGIVTGPTLGLVGEAGPEAIIPLRKLPDIIGASNQMELTTRVSGDDLYLIMQRANTRKNRIG